MWDNPVTPVGEWVTTPLVRYQSIYLITTLGHIQKIYCKMSTPRIARARYCTGQPCPFTRDPGADTRPPLGCSEYTGLVKQVRVLPESDLWLTLDSKCGVYIPGKRAGKVHVQRWLVKKAESIKDVPNLGHIKQGKLWFRMDSPIYRGGRCRTPKGVSMRPHYSVPSVAMRHQGVRWATPGRVPTVVSVSNSYAYLIAIHHTPPSSIAMRSSTEVELIIEPKNGECVERNKGSTCT